MAEAAGLVASIIAILELSAKVLGYLNDVKDASEQRAQCALEITNVHGLLEKLRFRIEEANDPDSWYKSARDVVKGDVLKQFLDALTQLGKGLRPQGRVRQAAEALRWKFKKEEVREVLARIGRFHSVMTTALQMDQFELLKAVNTDTKHIPNIQSMLEGTDQKKLTSWISTSNYPAEHAAILKRRQKGTGEWFVGLYEVELWLKNPRTILLCQGELGTGKSMLSAITIEHLLKTARSETVGIAWVFISHKTQNDDNVKSLLAALLKQLVQIHTSVAKHVKLIYNKHVRDESEISTDEILSELQFACETLQTTYVVVDALDECVDNAQRDQLVLHLRSLQLHADVRLLITSRVIPKPKALQGVPDMKVKARPEDIKQYVAGQTDKLPGFVKRDKSLQLLVQEKVAESAGDLFLLATLHVDTICDQTTKKDVITTLTSLGQSKDSLEKAYKDVIVRIKSQRPKRMTLAMRVLSWVTLARRPLTETELLCALAVEPKTNALDFDNMHEIEEVRSVCAGLITVEDKRRLVRLVHRTAQTYLESIIDQWNPCARLEIARTCLTYLSYDTFRTGRCSSKRDLKDRYLKNLFLLYAAEYWGEHALDVQDEVCDLACSFLLDEKLYACAAQAVFVSKPPFWDENEPFQDRSLTAAQYIAQHRLCDIMREYLCRSKKEISTILNPKGILNKRGTPLAIAATSGNADLVNLLVQSGAHDGRDALHLAILRDQAQVVRVLLDLGVPVDSMGMYSNDMSALSSAVSKNRLAIVEMLLDKNADIDLADSSQPSGTVLLTAIITDNVRLVRALLDAGADPCKGGRFYDSPLEAAVDKGHMDVVAALLEYNQVKNRQTTLNNALNIAAAKGRNDVAISLLDAGADPDAIFDHCNTLEVAANNGHQEMIKILYPVTVDRKEQTLNTYLYLAEKMAPNWLLCVSALAIEDESKNDDQPVIESNPDALISVPDALGISLEEENLETWFDRHDKHNRWMRKDTFPSSGADTSSGHVTQMSSSSMGVYDDDSD